MKKMLCALSFTFVLAVTGCVLAGCSKKYIVSFQANGADGSIESVEVKKGDFVLPENEFVYESKYFMGYRTGDAVYQPGETYKVTENTEFAAVWGVKITYTGLAEGEDSEIIVEINTDYAAKSPKELEHKTFTGWYIDDKFSSSYEGRVGEQSLTLYPKYESYSKYEIYSADGVLLQTKSVEYGETAASFMSDVDVKIPAVFALDCWTDENGAMLFDGEGKTLSSSDYVSQYYDPAEIIKIYPNVYDQRLGFAANSATACSAYYVYPVSGADFTDAEIKIPASYRGMPVRFVPEGNSSYAKFAGTSIKKIFIPAGITEIPDGMFENCGALTEIKFEDASALIAIKSNAFKGCSALGDLTFKASEIGVNAFSDAFSSEAIINIDLSACVDGSGMLNTYSAAVGELYGKVSDRAFGATDLGKGVGGAQLVLVGVKAIPDGRAGTGSTFGGSDYTNTGFFNCSTVKKIVIEGIESYGAYCFANTALTLKDITYTRGTSFGDCCFAYSRYGENEASGKVTFEIRGISVIPDGFLAGSAYITEVPLDNVTQIGANAFLNCTELNSLSISADCEQIDGSAFAGCDKLTDKQFSEITVSASNEVYEITEEYFKRKDGTQILIDFAPDGIEVDGLLIKTIPNGVTSIADNSYAGRAFNKIVIPYTVKTIGANAFDSCVNLSAVEFLKNTDGACALESIGAGAFKRCTGLTDISIPYSVETLGGNSTSATSAQAGVFIGCTNLETVEFEGSQANPSRIKSMSSTFAALTNLKSVKFSEYYYLSKENIEDNGLEFGGTVFQGATMLDLVLPWYTKSIQSTTVGRPVSNTLIAIKSLAFADGIILKEIPNSAFTGIQIFKTKNAAGEYVNATELVIPASVMTLGSSLFGSASGCKRPATLTKVSFEEGSRLTSVGASAFQRLGGTAAKRLVYDFSACENLASIGNTVFNYCNYIDVILNGGRITTVGVGLSNQTSLTLTVAGGISAALAENFTKLCVSGGKGPSSITIADATEIPANLFKGNTVITTVNLAENTTTIGANAFSGCTKLVEINNLDKVAVIDGGAFSGCSAATLAIELGADVASIGAEAFKGVKSVDVSAISAGMVNGSVTVAETAFVGAKVIGFNGVLIKDGTLVLYGGAESEVDLSDKQFSKIGNSAFNGNTAINSVILPSGVTVIDANAFYRCANLQYINLENVVTVNENAFYNCAALGSLAAGDASKKIDLSKVTSFGNGAFFGCAALSEANLSAAVSIGDLAFAKTGLTEVTFGANLETIGACAFANADKVPTSGKPVKSGTNVQLSAFNIPASVKTIGMGAFAWVGSLETLTFGGRTAGTDGEYKAVSIGNYAFYCCGLTSLTLTDGVTAIGNYAFANDSATNGGNSFNSVSVPKTVASIGTNAFQYVSALTSVTFEERESNVILSNKVFVYSGLTSVYVKGTGKIVTSLTTTTVNNSPFYNLTLTIYVDSIVLDEYTATTVPALKPSDKLNYEALPAEGV